MMTNPHILMKLTEKKGEERQNTDKLFTIILYCYYYVFWKPVFINTNGNMYFNMNIKVYWSVTNCTIQWFIHSIKNMDQ